MDDAIMTEHQRYEPNPVQNSPEHRAINNHTMDFFLSFNLCLITDLECNVTD